MVHTAYGLPADPRPGNLGGTRTPVRSNSPLNGTTARDRNNNLSPDAASAHARNTSLDKLNGVGIPGPSKLPLRSVHPYAAAQQLPLPPSGAINLSPINEGFASQPGSSSNASISAGLVAGRTPSPPNAAYTVGRGPFRTPNNANAGNANNNAGGPSLDELRRKVLKFSMFEQNQTRTIDVSNASSGLDVIEKALKKFGLLHSQRPLDAGDVTVGADGGMAVDGWGAFLDWDNQMACRCHGDVLLCYQITDGFRSIATFGTRPAYDMPCAV
jgi:mitogen-activated protein kinase kinase kinase